MALMLTQLPLKFSLKQLSAQHALRLTKIVKPTKKQNKTLFN